MKPLSLLFAGIITLFSTANQAETLSIAVASNFTQAMKDIATAYEEQSEHKVSLAFGSSGKFYAQILNGAPYQAFFSADQAKPDALAAAGWVAKDSRFTYAVGALALWSKNEATVDPKGEALRTNSFRKLAIANPKLAPYGLAAMQTLEHLGLTDAITAKLVRGENISQTYQFVLSGNAELGFVALSQIMANGRIKEGSAWLVPNEYHQPIRQDAVILKSAAENIAVKDFFTFVQSASAQAIIQRYGYRTE